MFHIVSVESVGMLSPSDLISEAINVLTEKCTVAIAAIDELE